ncbi:kinase-like protein [Gonapodya prolifera JEL478]|uniref:Kinase-like protein n=1 Tax=Gonapodya prolifera (strain JEL478) TaxID=1344416 RepID=A0A139AXV9_GONPJ|nr:kinase-like protein [Gonapodya prolifera JEL478]|eukprot:KXS21582.1 kinase-like protein [Gonapodya prolifera JEL478]
MVKLTQPDALNEKAEEERQESAVLTSFNELYIWSMLHHPCIHRLYGIGTIPGTSISFAAAEVINFDLMSYLEKHPDLTLVQKVRLMTDVARGMKLLHDKEFVHTNLKPKNILVSDNGNAMISDFSLARPFSEAADLSAEDGSRLLSLAYTSPERIEQWKSVKGLCSSSDMRSGIFPSDDVFSFGIVCAAVNLAAQAGPSSSRK